SCRSSRRSGKIALKPATFCLKPASVDSWSGAGLWSTRPGSQSASIVAWSPSRNACSKRVMMSMLSAGVSRTFPPLRSKSLSRSGGSACVEWELLRCCGLAGRACLRRLPGARLEEGGEQNPDRCEGDGDPECGAKSEDEGVG